MASQLLQQYVKLTEFLGHTLGPDYEVALHDLTDRNRSIVAIANSHVSGRKLGAPLTNTALKILRDKSYESQDYLLHYRGVSADGRVLRSSTFFIKQNGKLLGMLCINFDDSRYHAVSEEILRLCHPDKFVDTNFQVDTGRVDELSAIPAPPPERFHSSSGSVAEEAVYRALDRLGLSPLRLTPEERMEIIAGLEADGIFCSRGRSSRWRMRSSALRQASTATCPRSGVSGRDSVCARNSARSRAGGPQGGFYRRRNKQNKILLGGDIMVMELTPERAADFQTACAYERVFGSEILALLRVYGLDDGRVCFYLEEQEGSPAAAIALQDRALWVSARPGTGVDGLTALARSIDGLLEVNGDLATAQALQPILGGEIDSSVYMVYQGEMPPADPAVHTGTREEVFDLLQRGHPYFRAHHADFAPWAEEMARKQELGLAELFVMEAEGQLVGTGSIGAEDDECGVITSVAVVPEFRRRGYGGRITSAVTRRILEKGKVPRMNAGYEAVARLYRSLGFVDCGRWGCLCLEGLPT